MEARASNLRNFKSLRTGLYFNIKKPLFVLSHDLGGAENLVKRKDSELRGQSRSTFINMLADSQHTCVWVSNLLFTNCGHNYIGETGDVLRNRVTVHKQQIKLFFMWSNIYHKYCMDSIYDVLVNN